MKANLDLSVYYVEPARGWMEGGEVSFIKFYQPSGTISLFVSLTANWSRNSILHLLPLPAPCLSSILPSPDRSGAPRLLLWGQSGGSVRDWGTAKLSCQVFVFINKISPARIGNNLASISSRTPNSLHYLTDVINVSPARLASKIDKHHNQLTITIIAPECSVSAIAASPDHYAMYLHYAKYFIPRYWL